MDYLNPEDSLLDRPNNTVEMSDRSFISPRTEENLEKLTGTTQLTLHKAFSPGHFQATMTVAGDDDCSLDDSNETDKQTTTQISADNTKADMTKENRTEKSHSISQAHTSVPTTLDHMSTISSVRLSNDVPVNVPLCRICQIPRDQAEATNTCAGISEVKTTLSGLTSQSEEGAAVRAQEDSVKKLKDRHLKADDSETENEADSSVNSSARSHFIFRG